MMKNHLFFFFFIATVLLKQGNSSCCCKKKETIIIRKDATNVELSSTQFPIPQNGNSTGVTQGAGTGTTKSPQIFSTKSPEEVETIINPDEIIESTDCKCLGHFNEKGQGNSCENINADEPGARFCYVDKDSCKDIVITLPQNDCPLKALDGYEDIHYSFDICHQLTQQKINKVKARLELEESIVQNLLKKSRQSHKIRNKMVNKMREGEDSLSFIGFSVESETSSIEDNQDK